MLIDADCYRGWGSDQLQGPRGRSNVYQNKTHYTRDPSAPSAVFVYTIVRSWHRHLSIKAARLRPFACTVSRNNRN